VTTESGEPIPNAVVEVIPADLSVVPRVAVTDDKGVVTFSDVPRGAVRVIAGADGFAPATMTVAEGATAEIVLTRP
jgi:hypothetical protein